MELRQLRYLVGVVDAGSVSRAAQSLHVAQPALSAQIARLEEELGARLLIRSVRGVVPTEAGTAVLRQARLILKQVDAIAELAHEADADPTGSVSLGLPWTVRSVVGLPLLHQVRERLPQVRLEIIEGPSPALAMQTAQGKLDLAVVFENTPDNSLVLKPLATESLLLVGQRGSLVGRHNLKLEELAGLPLLMLSRPNGVREDIERQCAKRGIRLKIVAEINAPSLLIDAVRGGLGYSVLPACGIEQACRDGLLDAITLEGGSMQRTAHLGTSKLFALSRAAEHTAALLQESVAHAIGDRRWQATSPNEAD
ncbi:LysR family transcriptional regulator [Cupriavidus necator]|nr:LysR substrate-binding domain-containing protein [Cupriavidus necator]